MYSLCIACHYYFLFISAGIIVLIGSIFGMMIGLLQSHSNVFQLKIVFFYGFKQIFFTIN